MNVGSVGGGAAAGGMIGGGGMQAPQAAPVGNSGAVGEGVGAQPTGGNSLTSNINITNNNTQITQMSTQDFMSLHSGCQSPGSAGGVSAMGESSESGMDLQKLVEMIMMMMLMKMMQEMMGNMGGSSGGGMMG